MSTDDIDRLLEDWDVDVAFECPTDTLFVMVWSACRLWRRRRRKRRDLLRILESGSLETARLSSMRLLPSTMYICIYLITALRENAGSVQFSTTCLLANRPFVTADGCEYTPPPIEIIPRVMGLLRFAHEAIPEFELEGLKSRLLRDPQTGEVTIEFEHRRRPT